MWWSPTINRANVYVSETLCIYLWMGGNLPEEGRSGAGAPENGAPRLQTAAPLCANRSLPLLSCRDDGRDKSRPD